MTLKSPKQKGAAGELEAARLLMGWGAEVGVELTLERNLEQVRHGGADLNGVPGLEVEVKRQEQLDIKAWWRQVTTAANKSGKRPFLMYRQNRKQWKFRVAVYVAEYTPCGSNGITVPLVIDLELEPAKAWFQTYLKQQPLEDHNVA